MVRSATRVDAEVLEAGRDLKVVGRAGIGLDNVDVAAATRLGIMVVNAPQSNVISAAEHTVALILAQARNIPQAHFALREGRWERSRFQGAELYGKTLGIVGLGRVGALVAQRCNAFGMRLLAYDPFVSRERAAQMGVELASLAEVLGRADVVTVHLPKTPETTGLIGEAELAAMKPGARLVNTARGGIVDEAALAKAVGDGQLAGAALDVFAEEPTTASPLFELDNVVVTPHLGASTAEAQDKAGITIAEQLLLALAGQFVPNAVNVDAGPVPDALRPFLPLVEKLGQLYTALAGGGPGGRTSAVGGGRLQIDYVGALVEQDIRVLTLAALKGMLGPVCHEPVTFVNAPLLAAERGIEVTESKTRHSRDWVNLITLSGEGSRGPVGVAGTTVGAARQRAAGGHQRHRRRHGPGQAHGVPVLRGPSRGDRAGGDAARRERRQHRKHAGWPAQAGWRGPDGADRRRRHPRRRARPGGAGDRRPRGDLRPAHPDGSWRMSRTISGAPLLLILRCRGAAYAGRPTERLEAGRRKRKRSGAHKEVAGRGRADHRL